MFVARQRTKSFFKNLFEKEISGKKNVEYATECPVIHLELSQNDIYTALSLTIEAPAQRYQFM